MNDITLTLHTAAGFLVAQSPDEAERELDGLPPEAQGRPDVLGMRANCLIGRGKHQEAEKLIEALLRGEPSSMWFRQLLAVTMENQGRLEEAVALLQDAPPEAVKSALDLYHESRLLSCLGRHEEANECMARCVALDRTMLQPGGILAEMQ